MASYKKVVLDRVRKGSGQSTYVVASKNLGTGPLAKFLKASKIPYNKIYYGGGKVYVKIPSTAAQITGIYGQQTVYVDELGQGVSINPALVESGQAEYSNYPTETMVINPRTGESVPVSILRPEEQQSIYGRVLSPSEVLSGEVDYSESGPVSYVGSAGQPVTRVTERGLPVNPSDYGDYIYSQATPSEQAALHAQTFLSPRGWDYGASYITSFAFPGQRSPQDIVYENINDMSRIMNEEQRQQYVLSSAFFNPPAEVLYAYGGGLALGAATSAVPRLGELAASWAGKGAAAGLTGLYALETGRSVSGKLAKDDITGAGGDLLRAGSELTAMVSGFGAGQRIGGTSLLSRTDPGLGRGAKIAGSLEGTESEWLRLPRDLDITQLRGLSKSAKAEIFDIIGGSDSILYGSVSKQSQHMPGLVRTAADVDLATGSPKWLQNELLGRSPRGSRAVGDSIAGPGGHIFDIKRMNRYKDFPHLKPNIRAADDTILTRLDEEMWRSLYAAQSRGNRPGWQGAKDINRFYSAARTLAESKRLQAENARFFKGYKVGKAQKLIEDVELFRAEMPKITERLQARGPGPGDPVFSGSSYLPRGASRLPSMFGGSGSPAPRPRPPSIFGGPSSPTATRTPSSPIPPRRITGSSTRTTFNPGSPWTPSSKPPAVGGPSPPPIFKPPRPPKNPKPPRIPGFDFFGRPKSSKRGRGKLSINFGYAPSLSGLFIGGSIPKAPKVSSGIGIRAPVRRTRRK